MSQALSRAVLEELVDERSHVRLDGVEKTVALPDRATDGDFTPYDIEDPLLVDADPRVLLRGSRRAIDRTGTALRIAGLRAPGAGHRRRAARRRPRRRAPGACARRMADWDRATRRSSSPTRSSATLRSARTASSATGSHASSGITCGTSGAGSPSSARSTSSTASRLRDRSARISATSGSLTGVGTRVVVVSAVGSRDDRPRRTHACAS